jgi:cytochrome c oxidase assembly protein subunit 15
VNLIDKTSRERQLLGVAVGLTLAVVVLSAYLRFDAANLGCADWPACYAQLAAVQERASGALATVRRGGATALGLFALGYFIVALRRRRNLAVAAVLVALTILLTWVGFYTPSPLEPWVTLLNVTGGMAMLGLYGWLWLRPDAAPGRWTAHRIAAAFGLAVVFAQIALGAWASAHYAEPACPGLLCPGEVSSARIGDAFDLTRRLAVAEGRIVVDDTSALVQRLHRLGALLALLYIGVLALRAPRNAPARQAAFAILALLLGQMALGFAASVLRYPFWVALGHNALAGALLLGTVRLYHLYARS